MITPPGWSSGVVGDVVTHAQYGTSAATSAHGTRPIVGMRNLTNGNVSLKKLPFVEEGETDWAPLVLKKGDILLNRTNSPNLVGKVGIVREDSSAVFASYLVRLVPDLRLMIPEFLNYWLDSTMVQVHLRKLATRGVSQANINPTTFREYCPLLRPPLPEQRKIAEILRTWDEAIEDVTKQVDAVKKQASGMDNELFRMCHSSARNRPRDWRGFALADLCSERTQVGSPEDELLSVSQSRGVIPQADAGRKNSSSADRSRYKLVLAGDIAYNTMRMWQGASGVVSARGVISPAYTVVTPDGSRLDVQYAGHLFRSRHMMFDFERYSQGLTSDTWNLKFPAFSTIRIFLPPVEEQRRVSAALDELDLARRSLERYALALRTQKRGLMQKLLTGDLRVQVEMDQDS
ncbi:restriction endonuclease subunit S [Cryobacterium breve]|uniref:Restriction endonuclease subunit S n=1 Tax=Cryobacterium breve TaxID=1259258 RepID=A0ABY7N9I8_9MICO|nr:restriction endonuclease subunit S [Cryobacterium breve]WBM79136.1 restriction endonuclease subunit S [Cryobacterium breve]